MKKFTVEIKETLTRIIEVEAENVDSALSEIKSKYKNEEIVLTSDDYFDYKIHQIEI